MRVNDVRESGFFWVGILEESVVIFFRGIVRE